MSKTLENLMAAFAGESQARNKYTYFASVAKKAGYEQIAALSLHTADNEKEHAKLWYKEGLSGVAKVFRAAAAAETIHAHTHLKNAGKIGDTAANLQDAIGGETYEFTKMYPEMIKEAEAEGQTAVAKYMDMVNKVEEVHANLYKKAAADNHAFDNVDFYVCKVCGYTHEGPCDSCPVCGAKAAAFFKVDDACCLNK